jgi:outer membrane protein assembly factor BamB
VFPRQTGGDKIAQARRLPYYRCRARRNQPPTLDMIRLIPGDSWKLNPSYQATLRRLDEAAARRFSPSSILDVLGIEIDGVDIVQGQSETAIFQSASDMAEAVLALCADAAGRAQVSLGESRTELVLGRRGARASLSLVTLGRPARVVVGELEVELSALALATSDCATGLLADLAELNPALSKSTFARALGRKANALRKAARLCAGPSAEQPAAPIAGLPGREAEAGSPQLAFSLEDLYGRIDGYREGAELYSLLCPGRLWLRDAEGAELQLASGPPFLLLTELVRAVPELAAAFERGDGRWETSLGSGAQLRVDLKAGSLKLKDRTLACTPLGLAKSILTGALDFTAALTARNPALNENPYLTSLAEEAREELAHVSELARGDLFDDRSKQLEASPARKPAEAPLGLGTLKRLRFRIAWNGVDTGERARSLRLHKDSLIVLGRRRATWIDPASGQVRASRSGERAELAEPGVLLADRGRLEGYSHRGEPLFVRSSSGHDQPALTGAVGPILVGPFRHPATLCVLDGCTVAAVLSATGRVAWQMRAPQAVKVSAGAIAERAFVSADNGFLYALEVEAGQVVFRVRTNCAFEGPLTISSRLVASLGRSEGELWLAALDALSGRPRLARPLQMQKAAAPLIVRNRLVVPGLSEAGSVVAAFALDGREVFRATLPSHAGVPSLTAHRGRLYAALRDGSVTCLGPDGTIHWSAPPCGIELDRALAPAISRHVLIAAGDPIRRLFR